MLELLELLLLLLAELAAAASRRRRRGGVAGAACWLRLAGHRLHCAAALVGRDCCKGLGPARAEQQGRAAVTPAL